MNDPLLVVIPFHNSDAEMAENLCDWIFELQKHQSIGHCLLVADRLVHGERQMHIKVAAEVAFETADIINVNAPGDNAPKHERLNTMFHAASHEVRARFRSPWLWLEPDSVPLKHDWQHQLAMAYNLQPKRFMGPHMRIAVGDNFKICLARTSIYPANAADDLLPYCTGNAPFNRLACDAITPRSTKTWLIQEGESGGPNPTQIHPNTVLFHSDKTGRLIEQTRFGLSGSALAKNVEPAPTPVPADSAPRKRGRPRKNPVTDHGS